MPGDGADRRRFLGTTLAAGAGAMLLRGDAGFEVRLKWCAGAVHPLAPKQCNVYRGELSPGARVRLSLMIDGPEFTEPLCVLSEHLSLDDAVTVWPVRLAYNHPELVAGRYEYWIRMDVGKRAVTSDRVSYELNPFRFGI